jgi:two-component system, chemotaxis family, chemotaxis protein CheY
MKTCLVVDDSSVIRKVARRILEEMQFSISEAEDGMQALDMCRVGLPDVVFLDLNMPRMDGMTFLKEMRNLPGGSRPKVVFCTTERDMAHINQALRAGADEFVMKPFDRDIIEAKFPAPATTRLDPRRALTPPCSRIAGHSRSPRNT